MYKKAPYRTLASMPDLLAWVRHKTTVVSSPNGIPSVRKVPSMHLPMVGLSACLSASGLHAEPSAAPNVDDSEPVFMLDAVVVTGTRSERMIQDSPVRTEVVTQEEIERTHATNLTEALRYVPGLLLREIHGKSGHEVWLQGVNADRVLVLSDGLPVTATTGSSVDVSQLSLIDVERIEVVKGASSAQYGSSAMGGVVNIVPKAIPTGFSGEASLIGGSYGEQNGHGKDDGLGRHQGRLQLGLGSQQWRGRLALEQNESEGIDPDPSSWPRPGDATERRHLDGRLEWIPGDEGRAYIQASHLRDESESRYQTVLPGFRVDQSKLETLERVRLNGGTQWQ